jgi:hypothetical protein
MDSINKTNSTHEKTLLLVREACMTPFLPQIKSPASRFYNHKAFLTDILQEYHSFMSYTKSECLI